VHDHLMRGLTCSGALVIAGLIAGCSSFGGGDQTSAIATPSVSGSAQMAPNGQPSVQASMQPGMQSGTQIGHAVSLLDATCDQIKAELATFEADKIPQKLADFGKAKYHPTPEESIRFARYVDVSKASKDKNCVTAKVKKPITAQKAPAATAAPAAVAAKTTKAMKAVQPAASPAMPATPQDEGVTVAVPDSSG
jgi:hypothetical protein